MRPLRSRAVRPVLALAALALAVPAGARLPGRAAIIVQDFRNRSYEIRYDWIGTGLAYLVRKDLSNLGSLDLLEDRRAKPGDLEPVADFVIEGEIRLDESESKEEPKYIVFVTLDRTGESSSRRQFLTEGRSAQLFEMAGYLAERIAKHVGVDLDEQARSRFGRGMTANLTAFQLFAEAIVERRIHAKIEAYEKAVALDARFAEAHFHLARVHTVLRDYARAEAELRQAIEIVPDFAAGHNDLAYVLAQQGKTADAETEYRTALSVDPQDPKYRLNLGDLLRSQGKNDAARGEYEAVVRLRPDDLDAKAGLEALGVKAPVAVAVAPPVTAATPALVAKATPAVRPGPTPSPRPTATPAVRAATPAGTPPPIPPVGTPAVMAVAAPRATPTPAVTPPKPTPVPVPVAVPPPPATAAAGKASKQDQQELDAARQTATRARGDKAGAQALVGEAERALETGDRAAAYLAIGRLYLAEKLNFAAVTALRAAVEADPARKEAHERLAEAYERVGKKGEAAKERAAGGGGGS